MKPKKARRITYTVLACGVFTAFLGVALNETVFLIAAGLVLIFASIVFHVIFYRCPHCERFLDRSGGEFCPHCGIKVND